MTDPVDDTIKEAAEGMLCCILPKNVTVSREENTPAEAKSMKIS
jgi:hypothetical protein